MLLWHKIKGPLGAEGLLLGSVELPTTCVKWEGAFRRRVNLIEQIIVQNLDLNCNSLVSFRLGHHHQDKSNKPWHRRHNKPFIPNNPAEGKRLINQILQKAGLPPHLLNTLPP